MVRPETNSIQRVDMFYQLAFIRFPNCFALMKANGRYWVVWVTGFDCRDGAELYDEIIIVGRRFMKMSASFKTATFSFSSIHSYDVSEIEDNEVRFDKSELVGKGMCSYIRMDDDMRKTRDDEFTTPHRGQQWLFELMDHCVDYAAVKARVPAAKKTRRKRPRESS